MDKNRTFFRFLSIILLFVHTISEGKTEFHILKTPTC